LKRASVIAMRRVHAFGDDALGELDAVGLAEAIRAGRVSGADIVEAAIARAEAVNPALNGLAYEAFQQARETASTLQNVTGEPAISLPLAQSADGMPVGMMLSADLGQEARLLELAYELEEARPWARIQASE
jgi:Asp-tRNA(Asn)/Glu-tRNA(Gln) amidotransferase A subunit family amidase